jgi:hypothetical protein
VPSPFLRGLVNAILLSVVLWWFVALFAYLLSMIVLAALR